MKFVIFGDWAARFRNRVFDSVAEATAAVEAELEWTGAGRYAEKRGDWWLLDGETLAKIIKVTG